MKIKISDFLILFIGILLLNSCENKPSLEIKYTSVNDVYADYVFNFTNTTEDLKKINEYVTNKMVKAKKVADSVNLHLNSLTEMEAAEYLKNNNLPTNAENVTLYFGDKTFMGEPGEKEILIRYVLDEENFKIKDILIPNVTASQKTLTTHIKDSETIEVNVESRELSTEILKQILENKEFRNLNKNVLVRLANKKEPLLINFSDDGKYLSLDFK